MILASPAPSPDARADEIFARTRAAFVARAYPPTISYSVRVSGLRGGTWTGRSYRGFEHWPSSELISHTMSDEEMANPATPRGINIGFLGMTVDKDDNHDILGIPKLAPTYAFGLVGALPHQDEATTDTGAPRTIIAISATARTYDVSLFHEETVGGALCWHLLLRPVGNPGKYRLRDLWVDEKTYQTVQLRTDGNFTASDTGSGLWTVSYTSIDGFWYLSSEISEGSIETEDGTYDRIAVQFADIKPDPHEALDFGLDDTTPDEPDLTEP